MADLRDLLKSEIKTFEDRRTIGAFRRELAKRLPEVVRAAAEEAKKTTEKPQVENKVTDSNDNG